MYLIYNNKYKREVMEKSIIKIVNMSFKYKKEDYLFRNFNLEIKEGSFTTIIGKNGSGKKVL